ncbi:hypothetical protein [Neisseria dentiae]|uniref:hypothetical protein n=1 Tax=Neisseria dentiae TaxID=194197 RepID=UPI00117C88C7|nr:hypothetical protein [Neisseria dentiae]
MVLTSAFGQLSGTQSQFEEVFADLDGWCLKQVPSRLLGQMMLRRQFSLMQLTQQSEKNYNSFRKNLLPIAA